MRKKRNKRKKITQAKNKSTQAQVTQLTQAVIAYDFSRNERKRQPIGMLDRSSQSRLPTQTLALLAFFVYTTLASHAMHATQALALRALPAMRALRAFEWKPGLFKDQPSL